MQHKRDLRERARHLRAQGHSINDMRIELGVSKSSVSAWVRDIELSRDQIRHLDERRRRLLIASNRGAQANRIRYQTLRKQYQAEGLKAQNARRVSSSSIPMSK